MTEYKCRLLLDVYATNEAGGEHHIWQRSLVLPFVPSRGLGIQGVFVHNFTTFAVTWIEWSCREGVFELSSEDDFYLEGPDPIKELGPEWSRTES